MTSRLAHTYERARRSAWLVWLIGAGVYFFAQLHRASLGVAGPAAIDRLEISAAQLGSFVTVQLGLYALMQVPAGLAIDRWGPRKVLIAATLAMGTAQVIFGFATSYPTALGARALLGVGDAAVYISVLRLASGWFPGRRYAVLTMVAGLIGLSGNLLATLPLVISLETLGWTRTFVIAGATSIIYVLLLLRPAVAAPYRNPPPPGPARPEPFLVMLRAAVSRTETQLAFWTHQATQLCSHVIALVWGYPYLTEGLGYSAESAAGQLSLYVIATLVTNFFIGPLAGRHRNWRMPMSISIAVGCLLAVLTLVLWPGGTPPAAVVSAAFFLFACGMVGSQIPIQLARDYNAPSRVSTATGVVNTGGFIGGMITALLVGLVLDLRSGVDPPTLTDYRWAISTIAVVLAISTMAMLVTLIKVRRAVPRRTAQRPEIHFPAVPHWWDSSYAKMLRTDNEPPAASSPR